MNKLSLLAVAVGFTLGVTGCATQPGTPAIGQAPTSYSRVNINGVSYQTVKSFPYSAWRGLPPIRSANDLKATRTAASAFARAARAASDQGNQELALTNWYVAQQLSHQALAVMGSTLAALSNIDRNGDTTIPANGLLVLPSVSTGGVGTSGIASIWDRGVKVAGDSTIVLAQVLQSFKQPAATSARNGAGGGIADVATTLPLNTPVMLQNGVYVERRADTLVAYNSAQVPVILPLSKLNYIPPQETISAVRAAAAPYILAISQATWDDGLQRFYAGGGFDCEVSAPNKLTCGDRPYKFINEAGALTTDASSGINAYKANKAFKNAIDYLVWIQQVKQRHAFKNNCIWQVGGLFTDRNLGGGANIEQLACFPRNKQNTTYTQTLFIGDNNIVKTYDTLMQEKATRERMTKEARLAAAWADGTAYLPVVGTLEDGAKCLGLETSLVKSIYYGLRERYLGENFRDQAILANWKPAAPTGISIASTAIDCLGAIPMIGPMGKGAKVTSSLSHGEALKEAATRSAQLFETVQAAALAKDYASMSQRINRLYPGNTALSGMLHTLNDALQKGNDMASTVSALQVLVPEYFGL